MLSLFEINIFSCSFTHSIEWNERTRWHSRQRNKKFAVPFWLTLLFCTLSTELHFLRSFIMPIFLSAYSSIYRRVPAHSRYTPIVNRKAHWCVFSKSENEKYLLFFSHEEERNRERQPIHVTYAQWDTKPTSFCTINLSFFVNYFIK